jgi:hypothetical protein
MHSCDPRGAVAGELLSGKETVLIAPLKTDHFAKTGLGQT